MGTGLWITPSKTTWFFAQAVKLRAASDFRFLAMMALMLAAAAAAMAQTGDGATLVGTVKDSTGAVVAGAKVKAVNTATNYVSETATNGEGGYYVPFLPPGNYRLTVEAPGFKGYVHDGLILMAFDVPRVDIMLEVGAQTESVTVSGSTPLLNTENATSDYVLPSDVITQAAASRPQPAIRCLNAPLACDRE